MKSANDRHSHRMKTSHLAFILNQLIDFYLMCALVCNRLKNLNLFILSFNNRKKSGIVFIKSFQDEF